MMRRLFHCYAHDLHIGGGVPELECNECEWSHMAYGLQSLAFAVLTYLRAWDASSRDTREVR